MGDVERVFYLNDDNGFIYEEGEPDNPMDDRELIDAANRLVAERDARHPAPREAVEALIAASEKAATRMKVDQDIFRGTTDERDDRSPAMRDLREFRERIARVRDGTP